MAGITREQAEAAVAAQYGPARTQAGHAARKLAVARLLRDPDPWHGAEYVTGLGWKERQS